MAYWIPRKHECPKGHEQMGTGHVQTSEYGFEAGAEAYCRRCYLDWLSATFPTDEESR